MKQQPTHTHTLSTTTTTNLRSHTIQHKLTHTHCTRAKIFSFSQLLLNALHTSATFGILGYNFFYRTWLFQLFHTVHIHAGGPSQTTHTHTHHYKATIFVDPFFCREYWTFPCLRCWNPETNSLFTVPCSLAHQHLQPPPQIAKIFHPEHRRAHTYTLLL